MSEITFEALANEIINHFKIGEGSEEQQFIAFEFWNLANTIVKNDHMKNYSEKYYSLAHLLVARNSAIQAFRYKEVIK